MGSKQINNLPYLLAACDAFLNLFNRIIFFTLKSIVLKRIMVSDPHQFHADPYPDPGCEIFADRSPNPDPGFEMFADPDVRVYFCK